MLTDNEHITVSSRTASKTVSEIALTHKHIVDLFGEVKTVPVQNRGASISAVIYEKGSVTFREIIEIGWTDYRNSGVPYKVAVTNAQNELVAKLKAMMHEIALKREVIPEEQAAFTKMLENTRKAFPNLSREQGMHLALDALKAKRRRQIPGDDGSE